MPTLAVTNFNIVLSVLGGWISLFGLVSYLCKEKLYLSEPLISLLAGVMFSPHALNLIRPMSYISPQTPAALNATTLAFSRLVLGVQLVLAGVQLPSRYLQSQRRPLLVLLGPVMAAMWLVTSLLVLCLVVIPLRGGADAAGFLHALAIGACVTPTDPVLSNVIVKGRFADANVPRPLQRLIVAESGANDGLGYPFLFVALWLVKYTSGSASLHIDLPAGGAGAAMGHWFGETWGYVIILGTAYGAAAGWGAKELLHWAERRRFVDRESFLVFAVALALFVTGTAGMVGTDDVLACFVAGNVFTWDDWFRLETLDDSLQPTVDMLLNVTIFMWYGAVCPWHSFAASAVIPLWRLVVLGALVLLLRRLPAVLATHRLIPQIAGDGGDGYEDDTEREDEGLPKGVGAMRRALFVGFFGPVGVSAVFYLYVALEFVETLRDADGGVRADVEGLGEMLEVVVWFVTICSVVVHGLTIPFGKLLFHLPRHVSRSTTPWSPGRLSRVSTTAVLSADADGLPVTRPGTGTTRGGGPASEVAEDRPRGDVAGDRQQQQQQTGRIVFSLPVRE